jgi:hypothetical protein
MLLTGMHTISNITCKGCEAPLGWVYIKASDPAQKYKEGEHSELMSESRTVAEFRLDDKASTSLRR